LKVVGRQIDANEGFESVEGAIIAEKKLKTEASTSGLHSLNLEEEKTFQARSPTPRIFQRLIGYYLATDKILYRTK
jgi:hypothetical protein